MTEEEKLNRLFSILLKIKWINSERFRNGVIGIIKECESEEQFEVIDHVLSNLKYHKSSDLEEAGITSAAKITESWGLVPQNTNIVGLADKNATCGSTAYLRAIEIHLSRSWGDSIYTNFDSAFRHRKDKENLVLVDDFVGTGEKLSRKISALLNNPKTANYKIHILVFAGMNFGIEALRSLVNDSIYTHITLDKCLSTIQPREVAEKFISHMRDLERKIFTKSGDYSLGYKQSEAAFFLEASNIPNNNFPILWWDKYADNTERATLFTRR